MNRNLSVLAGNGLSIAANNDLRLSNLTEKILNSIQEDDFNRRDIRSNGPKVVEVMQKLAGRISPSKNSEEAREDFEQLIGYFSAESRSLSYLSKLDEILSIDNANLGNSFSEVINFLKDLGDIGRTHVLQTVYTTHIVQRGEDIILKFLNELVNSFDNIKLNNLNYDNIIMRNLINLARVSGKNDIFCDLANGSFNNISHGQHMSLKVHPLRKNSSEIPSRKVVLNHLHGSVLFWRNVKGFYFKVLSSDLSVLWEQVRTGVTELRPVVVLENAKNKSEAVQEYPFNLGYEIFEDSLRESDYWLIIGYSFRDVYINDKLKSVFKSRQTNPPKVHVIDLGEVDKVASVLKEVLDYRDGWPYWLSIDTDGVSGFSERPVWHHFKR